MFLAGPQLVRRAASDICRPTWPGGLLQMVRGAPSILQGVRGAQQGREVQQDRHIRPSPPLLVQQNRHRRLLLAPTPSTGLVGGVRDLGIPAKLVSATPSSVQPFLRLARLDRPIGSWLLFWPCGWSLSLATAGGSLPSPEILFLFGAGALVMRGAGCTINDMWDRNIDNKVERTKGRPITSGQVSMFDALVFLGGQLGVGLLILLQLNWYSVLLGAASLGLVVTYPLMKRFTYYPQFILGLTFNWGALLGWSAVAGYCDWSICLPLYLAGISWTMIYDTIYAHQDKYDDVILGMKSTAIKFGERTPACLSCFATSMLASLGYCGWVTGQTAPYYLSLALVAGHLSHQISTLDIHNGDDCAKKFISNRWVGLCVFVGIMAGTWMKDEQVDTLTMVGEVVGQVDTLTMVEDVVGAVKAREECR